MMKDKWPVLRRYDINHLRRIAMPIGGIGTGTVSLGGRGDLRDWEIVNRPAKGFIPRVGWHSGPFFVLWVKEPTGKTCARILEGPIDKADYEGASGCTIPNHGLPRFKECSFAAAYPLGQVSLADPEMPLSVRLEAFNPLVPADEEASGIPCAILRYVLINNSTRKIRASVCGTIPNFIGCDGTAEHFDDNRNVFREGTGIRGVFMFSRGLDKKLPQWGTIALATVNKGSVSYRTNWAELSWGDSLLDFWDDFTEDGRIDDRPSPLDKKLTYAPAASLAVCVDVLPNSEKEVTFIIAWHFPNRMQWTYHAGEVKKNRNITAFVNSLYVSDFMPLTGSLRNLDHKVVKKAKWVRKNFNGDMCDMHVEIGNRGNKNEIIFYKTAFTCPSAMNLNALLGYDGPVKVWMDGKEVFCDETGTNPANPDEVRIGLGLCSKGRHEVVVALCTNKGKAWGIFLRLERTGLAKEEKDSGKYDMPAVENVSDTCGGKTDKSPIVGNWYAKHYKNAWDVAQKTADKLSRLEKQTVKFVKAFCESDLPDVVKEAALFNLSTLRSQTVFRTADGKLFGWEGCGDKTGCCHGSCTHVWNYEQATAFLFGNLARTMREVEFLHSVDEKTGLMSFRVGLPLDKAREFKYAAADGQMGCIMKLYREWKMSGDDKFLRKLWPFAKKALEFCWIKGGWDGDMDGVMEGCQHNTMDVEYFGPNPQMQAWYLGALRAAECMAEYLGDKDFSVKYRNLFENGSKWVDEHLFNGEYYEHIIKPPVSENDIAPGLRVGMGALNLKEPELQLGAGCLVDQLVGQYMAHVCGLGYLLNRKNVRKALESVFKYNFKKDFSSHFNHLRSFVLGGESALLMATYPRGRRPKRPFPYYNEVMTGFEYTAAVGMIYEGMIEKGLKCIKAVRDRYDGYRRSPFDEAECGHHYVRAMASWAAVPAMTGFQYDAVNGIMIFAKPPKGKKIKWFWSTGDAWGIVSMVRRGDKVDGEVKVLHGRIKLKKIQIC